MKKVMSEAFVLLTPSTVHGQLLKTQTTIPWAQSYFGDMSLNIATLTRSWSPTALRWRLRHETLSIPLLPAHHSVLFPSCLTQGKIFKGIAV